MISRKFMEYTPVILLGFMCLLMIYMIIYGAVSKDDITWMLGVVGLQVNASILGIIMGDGDLIPVRYQKEKHITV